MALHSFWNPLRSYEIFKQSNDIYVSSGIDDNTPDDQLSSLWTKLKGTFYMFSGYLGDLDHTEIYEIIGGPDDGIDELVNVIGKNHMGIYDYLTFGIPYAIEAFFRGSFFESKKAQNIFQIIFSVIPIVPALAAVRDGLGLIATIVSSPVVLGIHIGDIAYSAWKSSHQAKQEESAFQADLDEVEDVEGVTSAEMFMDSYKKLSSLLIENKNTEHLTTMKKIELHQKANIYYGNAMLHSRLIYLDKNKPDSKLLKRVNKIADNEKYSEQAIAKTFGHSM